MASKVELAKQYMDYQREQKVDDMLALMADDVSMTSPMTGAISGKDALAEQMRNRPMGGGGGGPMGNITWGDPEEDGDAVKIIGTGSSFGNLKIVLGFNANDQISSIEAGLA
ncbi:MAG: nuclear transport factor 2 family protein [Dehalococcoidia bacterium]